MGKLNKPYLYRETHAKPRNHYCPRPRLILEKNLYGLDIDDRAAQLAGFALLMKARADDRRLLENPPQLNVLAIQASNKLRESVLLLKVVSMTFTYTLSSYKTRVRQMR